MGRRWNPSLHPRDRRGRFRPKLIGRSVYVGRGGRYTGVKAGAEFRVGRRDVLVKGIVGVAPASTGPGTRVATAPVVKRSVAPHRKGARHGATFQSRTASGHVRTVVELRTSAAQRAYLDRLNSYVIRQIMGQLPGPLQNYATRLLAQRQAQQRRRAG